MIFDKILEHMMLIRLPVLYHETSQYVNFFRAFTSFLGGFSPI